MERGKYLLESWIWWILEFVVIRHGESVSPYYEAVLKKKKATRRDY